MTFTKTQRRILALKAEQEFIYELVEASALTATKEGRDTLFARTVEIEHEIAALKREVA